MNDIKTETSVHNALPGNEVPPRQGAPSGTPTLSLLPPDRVLQRKNGKLSGVAGGFADYFSIDVTIVRLAIVALTLLAGPAIPLAYIVAWMIIPEEDVTQAEPPAPGATNTTT